MATHSYLGHQFTEGGLYRGIRMGGEYVFFNTLQKQSYQAAHAAYDLMNSRLSNLSDTAESKEFSAALRVLKSYADYENDEETAFILEQLSRYENIISLMDEGPDKNSAQERLISWTSRLPRLGADPIQKINLINEMISGQDNYKQRISDIIENNLLINKRKAKPGKKNGKDTTTALRRNLAQSINTLMDNLTGRKREKVYKSYEEIMRLAVKKYLDRPEFKDIVLAAATSQEGAFALTAIAAQVQDALVMYFQSRDAFDYHDATNQEIDNYYEEIDRLLAMVDDFGRTIAGKNLSSLSTNQGLMNAIIGNTSAKKDKRNIRTESRTREVKNGILNAFKKQDLRSQVLQQMENIDVKQNNNVSYLDEIYDLISRAVAGAATGKTNAATDTVLITSLHIAFPELKIKDEKFQEIQKASKILDDIMNEQTTEIKPTADVISKNYTERLMKAKEKLADVMDPNEMFVIHESNKFYTSLETLNLQDKNSGFSGFHGREMGLFTMIEMMGSLADTEGGISKSALTTLGLNLSPDTINGPQNQDALKRYLAAMAGMIMFDDFTEATTAIINQRSQRGRNIHLYRLNDVLVPTSYFLQQTYDVLSSLNQEISSGDAFKVNITGIPTFNYQTGIKPPANNGYGTSMYERWERVREKAISSTKANISFGAAFMALIGQLGQ